MTKKFIAFDIDGTLVNTKKQLLDSTKEALKQLKINGHEIVIATGRNYELAKNIIDELEIDTYVLCNGSLGYVQNELLHESVLSKETLTQLIKVATEHNHQIIFQTSEGLRRHFHLTGDLMDATFSDLTWSIPEFDDGYWEQNSIIQVILFCEKDDLKHYDTEELSEVRCVSWHPLAMDIIPRNGSKAATILKIAEGRGFKAEDIVFFGDGMNDIELIEQAGIGVAMGNAVEKVKEKADLITDHCDRDGIYNGLKRLSLI